MPVDSTEINETGKNLIHFSEWVDLLEHLKLVAYTVDMDHRITSINESAKVLLGMEGMDIVGIDCRGLTCGSTCHGRCPFIRDKEDPPEISETDLELITISGDKHLVSRLVLPLYGPNGDMNGCLTVLKDYSAYTDLIDRIDYEEQRLKNILDNLDIGVFTVNRGGYITFFNTAAESITGFSRNQLLGKNSADLFIENRDQNMELIKSTIIDGEPRKSHKGRIHTRTGENIPVSANFMPLKNTLGKIIGGIVTFKDLTLAQQYKQVMTDRYTYHDMIGKGPIMQKVFETVSVISDTDTTVLIEGATGTGKDFLAKVIHSSGKRKENPFVKVNCAAIPENLLESELFGFVKGAFTSADHDKRGRFMEAHNGTMFLDEIGDLPMSLQAKLLRVIEDREFYPLGSSRTVKVDVRIISATNRKLEKMVKQRLFREDLFYRLNVFRIELPSLCDRKEDLPILIRHILRKLSAAREMLLPKVSGEAMETLLNYDFPGNIRELENILEHALIISREGIITGDHLPTYLERKKGRLKTDILEDDGIPDERNRILNALNANSWRRSDTARALNMDRTTLWRKMKKWRLNMDMNCIPSS